MLDSNILKSIIWNVDYYVNLDSMYGIVASPEQRAEGLDDEDVLVAEAEAKLIAWKDAAVVEARLQMLMNIEVRLQDGFTRRELSSDNTPDGYRKMTDKEIYMKVIGAYANELMSQVSHKEKGR